MNITIQKASPSDAAEILEYLKQVGGETDNLTFGAEGLPFTVEQEVAFISKLEHSSNGAMFVAKDAKKIIGSATISRMPRRMSHRGDFSITVLKEYWNNGIGGQLLSHIIDYAKENGFRIIDLQVRSDNASAVHLYAKYGFKKLCTYPDFFKIGDAFFDVDFMCLDLSI